MVLLLGAIEPVLHVWIPASPPEGMTPSGLHTVDTYAFMSGMKHYGQGCYSPYAKCGMPHGRHHPSLYALPHHRMYGIAGLPARAFPERLFQWLGLVNGLGAAFMLLCAWLLLREVFPRRAGLAFLIYALGGGVGGLAYLAALAMGWTSSPDFGDAFLRFFVYELNEGARYQPYLLLARLYYTIPLGMGFLGLAFWFRGVAGRTPNSRASAFAGAVLLGICTFLNFRVGPMLGAAAILMAFTVPGMPFRRRLTRLAAVAVACAAGAAMALRMLAENPELTEGAFRSLSGAAWLMPLLYAACFPLALAAAPLVRGIWNLPWPTRLGGGAVLGYVVLFVPLYLCYQGYYGNWLRGGDTNAAIAVSDWAFLGALAGMALVSFVRRRGAGGADNPSDMDWPLSWAAVWFILFLGASISAFGAGWFLQYMPSRFMVVLGIPLAMLAAEGFHRAKGAWRIPARALLALSLLGGVVSISLTWTVFYGPLGVHGAQRHFPWVRQAYVTTADQQLMDAMGQGAVLAPALGNPLFGDVLAVQRSQPVVYGNGTLDYSRQVMPEVRAAVAAFFEPGAPIETRRALLESWCVRYVLCPNEPAVRREVREELARMPELRIESRAGEGVLFSVEPAERP